MGAQPDVPLSTVSYHAVTRYVQRVLGVELAVRESLIGTKLTAWLHCWAADTSIDAVRTVILTDDVTAAIRAGMSFCKSGGLQVSISRDTGVVLSVRPDSKPARRARFLGKKEGRRHANRMGKRRAARTARAAQR